MTVLSHLQHLTHYFEDKDMYGVFIYSHQNPNGVWLPDSAPSEGSVCLDDVARAALLAFELYEDTKDVHALEQALEWMSFVSHMQDHNGKFANFVDEDSTINERGDTSYRGGQWWQGRGLWALARSYRITGNEKWLDSYWRALRHMRPTEGKTMALLNLAKIEVARTGVSQDVIPTLYNTYYRVGETWGYHQILEGVLASKYQGKPLTDVRRAIIEFIEPMVTDMFWSEWKTHSKVNLCAYNVSPIVQALAEIYILTGESRYESLLESSYGWFFGRNDETRIMYDVDSGRCFDGLTNESCGSESSLEAGLAHLAFQRATKS